MTVLEETPLEHIRGTTFVLRGKVRQSSGSPKDLTGDTLYFVLAKEDRATVMDAFRRESPSTDIVQDALGNYQITLPGTMFSIGNLGDDVYWVQVDHFDGVSTYTTTVGRGPLTLLANPRF